MAIHHWICISMVLHIDDSPPFTGVSVHRFCTLDDMKTRIQVTFAEQLKECSKKITDMCKREKELCMQMDTLEEECNRLLTEVDNKEKQLVSKLTSRIAILS